LARLRVLDQTLADGRQFLCEGRFTVADIVVAYALWLGRRHRPPLDVQYSAQTRAYLERLTTRPEFISALGEEAASLEAWDPSALRAFL
jgi:glutathione S-transferase